MPSSVKVGSRPIRSRMRRYSSGFSPCAAIRSSVMSMSLRMVISIPSCARSRSRPLADWGAFLIARRPAVDVGGNALAFRPVHQRPEGADLAGGTLRLHDQKRAAAEIALRHQKEARPAGKGIQLVGEAVAA